MPTPLPASEHSKLVPPDRDEAQLLAAGVVSAAGGHEQLTPLQAVLIEALFDAMTGHGVSLDLPPVAPDAFAAALADRNETFRVRILQVMILTALVVRPLSPVTVNRLEAFAAELSVGDGMLGVARDFATGSLGLAAVDFERNGYTSDWDAERRSELHTSDELHDAWQLATDDEDLAARWEALESLPAGTLGRRITEFYRARGFEYPGRPGSAPPLLAQHDWVHLVADYGTRVESELEVFAFIARANDDPRAFSLLAMVVSLFETGYLATGAGLFEAFPGQLSRDGVATRLADAMRRGALVDGSIDFMNIDWFTLAHLPVEAVQQRFGVVPKSAAALTAASVGPWEPGGISEYQLGQGIARATRLGGDYDSFGAAV
jgi:hypothetical protein